MNQRKPPPPPQGVEFKISDVMLCCGGRKDAAAAAAAAAAGGGTTQNTPSRQPMSMQPYPMTSAAAAGQQAGLPGQPGQMGQMLAPPIPGQQHPQIPGGGGSIQGPNGQMMMPQMQQHGMMPGQAGMGLKGQSGPLMGQQQPGRVNNSYDMREDYKKPSGISEDVFRQLETVQNRYDSTTAAAFREFQKTGNMIVRTLDPRQFMRLANETAAKINIDTNDPDSLTSFVEIVKRPGQTLGLYIREGNGIDRNDGVFISRIAIDSAVYKSGCLQLGDEILAVNLVDVTRMSLDDVVIIMSIPRRLVLTSRRSLAAAGGYPPRQAAAHRQNGTGMLPPPPVVVFKGNNVPNDDLYHPHHGGGGHGHHPHAGYGGHRGGDPLDSPPHRGGGRGSDYLPYRDARTLTWDRNPKPDRSDPKYFPVNSLPRQNHSHHRGGAQPGGGGGGGGADHPVDPGAPGGPPPLVDGYPGGPRPPDGGGDPMMGPHPPPRGLGGAGGGDPGMPPPMRELSTGMEPRYGNNHALAESGGGGGNGVGGGNGGGDYYGGESDSGIDSRPGRGTRLLHRMAADPGRYGNGLRGGGGSSGYAAAAHAHHRQQQQQQQYPNHLRASSATHRTSQYSGGDPTVRLEYASDTDALHSPAGSSIVGAATASGSHRMMNGNVSSSSIVSRSSSLPRTFQREALLRHPELSMELDRLTADPAAAVALVAASGGGGLSTDDQMSDSGAISAPESVINMVARKRGYRSPSSFSAIDSYAMNHLRSHAAGHHSSHHSSGRHSSLGLAHTMNYGGYGNGKSSSSGQPSSSHLIHRTPSTSAIYETLRRSKELRESINSRPSSRMSLRDTDTNYFSDSEHHLSTGSYSGGGGGGGGSGSGARRIRNRHMSGLDAALAAVSGGGGPPLPGTVIGACGISGGLLSEAGSSRPSSANARPITPSFHNDKDSNGQQFVDFNPADFIKYKSEVVPENGGLRLSGLLNLHLLSGRGLRTGGRSRRIRDLYCVVEVDHIHKARTVVRSGGINFDWGESFDLDLANNLEVEFLVYSWDPQLRHRLCYRSSLRLSTLFGKGQSFQQVALRLHPAGTLYLTLSYADLPEAYCRAKFAAAGVHQKLFGVDLETVLEREAHTGYLVPSIVRRCVDEVERRGLDIVGIYRLCGATTKKNILRLAFEESADIVDLSSMNVPDINVITSLLKEYLRELPQPVFSGCLYQMLVDAMGVFLPDDPDGNAKLIFSILDCLPKANRDCLVHVMDHLSRVTAQHARNKMNPQNLSIVFAPVLMLDFAADASSATPANAVSTEQGTPNISEPIQVLKYLVEIWPKAQG